MKKYKSILLSPLVAFLLTSCDPGEFGDINVNPNNPASANTSALLTGAQLTFGTIATDVVPAKYAQQLADVTYIEESRYKTINWSYNGWYSGPLNTYSKIIETNTAPDTKVSAAANGSNANQIAIARISKAATFLWITDRWGDIPYTQALKGKENFSPSFDKQQDIYNDLFKELREAAVQFDGGKTVVGDIIFNGNAAKWKKYANSLRMVMALRISKVDPAKGKAEFTAAMTDGVLTSNADNVKYTYLTELNNENFFYNNYITTNRKDHAVSNKFIAYLKATSDPRISAMASKNINLEYVGVPYGVFPVTWKSQDISLVGSMLSQQNSPANLLTYAQLLFCQAEAAKLGWITGSSTKDLYEKAIQASMQQWLGSAYTEQTFTTFIGADNVKYNDGKALELIGNQKWVALFSQGNEAWAEWRRTGFPVLAPPAKTLNITGQIPRRMAYPTTEGTLNKVNYDAVITTQGPDAQETRIWWDKR
jgi:hypothetical protein